MGERLRRTIIALVLTIVGTGLAACAGSVPTASERAREDRQSQVDQILRVADTTRRGGDFVSAAGLYRRAHQMAPKQAAPLIALGETLAVMGDIPLNTPWKVKIYQLAHGTFLHPAWGWQHSERDYRMALRLAREDHLKIDEDALFAAAFLHDMAAFRPCKKKMPHGKCAALQSPAILKKVGFPMQKIAIV